MWGVTVVGGAIDAAPGRGLADCGGVVVKCAFANESLARQIMVAGVMSAVVAPGRHSSGARPPRIPSPVVTVVVPARDAAGSLSDTLTSLRRQTAAAWEAIVVDDGSLDDTAAIAQNHASRDTRIRLLRQPALGVCAARNSGVAAAHAEWVLFLDAGDALQPEAIERLLSVAVEDDSVGAVFGGCVRVGPDGAILEESAVERKRDLFELFARCSPFALHAVLVRRVLVQAVGGWDRTLDHCEDWDLWQRIARTGVRFGATPERLAVAHPRTGITASVTMRKLADGVRVLRRGHSSDPRVCSPSPRHVAGRSPALLGPSLLLYACESAGQLLAMGDNATVTLDAIGEARCAELDAQSVAAALLRGAWTALPELAARPRVLWDRMYARLATFLDALETKSSSPALAVRTRIALERRLIETSPARPLQIGSMLAMRIDATAPIPEIRSPGAQRLICDVVAEGTALGRIELPVVDGLVPAPVLADAIAADCAAALAARFFGNGASTARRAESNEHPLWLVFQQELWGRREWTRAQFRDPTTPDHPAHVLDVESVVDIELSRELPELRSPVALIHVGVTVGGVAIGTVDVVPENGRISPQRLRAAVIEHTGFELCRAAVREGLLGRPLRSSIRLRARLAEAAARREARGGAAEWPVVGDGGLVVFGMRSGPIGTSVSRRAALPAASAPELLELAVQAGEPLMSVPGDGARVHRAVYAPDIVGLGYGVARASVSVDREVGKTVRSAPASGTAASTSSATTASRAIATTTSRLPILAYRRITEDGKSARARCRVTVDAFQAQLRYLRNAGFCGITLEDWRHAAETRAPLSGRAVIITFDAGYLDFHTHAWPLLRDYGFPATVFLVSDAIGGTSTWDGRDPRAPLLSWPQIRELQDEGVQFGSNTATYELLTGLTHADVVREAARSRATLERGLGRRVDAIAYPDDQWDHTVAHLIGACGYVYGLTCRPARASLDDPLLALPRIEICGSDDSAAFVHRLQDRVAWPPPP